MIILVSENRDRVSQQDIDVRDRREVRGVPSLLIIGLEAKISIAATTANSESKLSSCYIPFCVHLLEHQCPFMLQCPKSIPMPKVTVDDPSRYRKHKRWATGGWSVTANWLVT